MARTSGICPSLPPEFRGFDISDWAPLSRTQSVRAARCLRGLCGRDASWGVFRRPSRRCEHRPRGLAGSRGSPGPADRADRFGGAAWAPAGVLAGDRLLRRLGFRRLLAPGDARTGGSHGQAQSNVVSEEGPGTPQGRKGSAQTGAPPAAGPPDRCSRDGIPPARRSAGSAGFAEPGLRRCSPWRAPVARARPGGFGSAPVSLRGADRNAAAPGGWRTRAPCASGAAEV